MKKYLIIMQQSLYENSLSMEALEFAFAVTAFGQQVSLLFRDNGILQLLREQPVEQIIAKDFTKAYAGLDLFDIHDVYVEECELIHNKELLLEAQIVNTAQVKELKNAHDIVITI